MLIRLLGLLSVALLIAGCSGREIRTPDAEFLELYADWPGGPTVIVEGMPYWDAIGILNANGVRDAFDGLLGRLSSSSMGGDFPLSRDSDSTTCAILGDVEARVWFAEVSIRPLSRKIRLPDGGHIRLTCGEGIYPTLKRIELSDSRYRSPWVRVDRVNFPLPRPLFR